MSAASVDVPSVRLRARGLSVRLGGSEVIRGVDLDLEAGKVRGVLGPSGAGKTTLFRALVGEIRPDAGEVALDGVSLDGLPLWRRARVGLGYVPQTPSVLFDLDVRGNLETFRRVIGGRARDVAEEARRVGLEGRLAVKAGDLSGGERRRLELLRALLAHPTVLVCDEPFAGVDPEAATALGDLLRNHADAGAAVVIADHRVGEALRICDEASLLVDGRLELTLPAGEFASHPAVQRRYLG